MYDDTSPLGPDRHTEPRFARDHLPAPAAESFPAPEPFVPRHARAADHYLPQHEADFDGAESSAHVLRRIEATAVAAGALQSALMELELELYRLQTAVRRASPAMAQLMQAATEMRAAGIDENDRYW